MSCSLLPTMIVLFPQRYRTEVAVKNELTLTINVTGVKNALKVLGV